MRERRAHGGARRLRASLALLLLAVAAIGLAWPLRAQPAITTFPLRVHVARRADGDATPVVSESWLTAQIAAANELFAPHGVGFVVGVRHALPDAHAALETRADRHALGALLDRAQVDWFVVRSLRDVDDPTQMRRGVHWRPAGRPGAHFVVVSAIAGPTVLAHELGHYFGNPHSPTPGNIMSYDRGEVPPFFDAAQSRRIARSAARFARDRAPLPIDRAPSTDLPPERSSESVL